MPKIFFEEVNEEVCKFAKKPLPSFLSKPAWFKESEYFYKDQVVGIPGLNHSHNATIKNCPGISDAINFGYTLFTPVDIYIDATDEEKLHWYTPDIPYSTLGHENPTEDLINYHPLWQMEKYKVPDGYHKIPVKINTFFGIKTEPGYSIWVTHPLYNDNLPFISLSGIIDTDNYPLRFPNAVFIKSGFKGTINAGTPLIQVIPFKREDWESEIISVNHQEISDFRFSMSSRFSNVYKKLFWNRKKFN